MGVKLYEHNEKAYRAAARMLAETGRAAVIHPTGTGKSFIGFRLCEEHPEQRVCWLSPSEYIFRTQRENLLRAGGAEPENIRFYTYARLMQMSEGEMEEIGPEYIILDEFHRCGAEMWGKGVQALLRMNPKAPVLGLSATSIRYLDNQRDMAEELFWGNVASEMTLGEAIARGILAAPKYVVSVYAYRKELERYEKRVYGMKNRAARNLAEKYLEALRRSLEKADGLDEVFARHMSERTGKYLVFCANVRHMEELLECCGTWFERIDTAPHIYRAYSEDPETTEAFRAFKEDESGHLKLLFCIDMLNEGIHVEGVAGVILFRPTVSPVIYKQQIGRALTASGSREPVIFDVVNNFENLYSIGTLQAEMEAAGYGQSEEEREQIRERFRIIDEVRESRALFEALQETLSAPWEAMYARAKAYYEARGNLKVPKRYKTEDGYSLGAWIATQRRVRAGQQYGTLTAERIAKLDGIGMIWENRLEQAWERGYRAAQAYYEERGDLLAETEYVTEDGYPLGQWLTNQRTARVQGNLDPSREERLREIGMVWSRLEERWEQNFRAAERYAHQHGHLNVPAEYQTDMGTALGQWIVTQRREKRRGILTEEQICRLEELGMIWEPYRAQWERMYAVAAAYFKEHGNLLVPAGYRTADGLNLGRWIYRQRESYMKKRGLCREDLARRLERIGMVWNLGDAWEARYRLAKKFYEEHGNLNVPGDYVVDGIWLGKWLNEQKQICLGRRPGKHLTEEQIAKLAIISFQTANRNDLDWEEQYAEAKRYFEAHGDLTVPMGYVGHNGKRLDLWVARQRSQYREGGLPQRRRKKVAEIGIRE